LTFAEQKSKSKVKLNFGLLSPDFSVQLAQQMAERKAKSKVKVAHCAMMWFVQTNRRPNR